MTLRNRLLGEEPGFIKLRLAWMAEGRDTGNFGEYLTEYALKHGVLGGHRHVFRNVLVPRESGPTTESEVDVLLLHDTGIYIMESKHYDGWIFGDEWQQRAAEGLLRSLPRNCECAGGVDWHGDNLSPQVTPQVTPQVESLVAVLGDEELSLVELMERLGLSDRKSFRRRYLNPALEAQAVERTIPDKPTSGLQRYRARKN